MSSLNIGIKDELRLLQSAGNICRSHITGFLEFILKPIRANLCKNGQDVFCQDSRQYLGNFQTYMFKRKDRLNKRLANENQKPLFYVVTADVKELHPNLCRGTVSKTFECALKRHSIFHTKARKIVVEVNKICPSNVVGQVIYPKTPCYNR